MQVLLPTWIRDGIQHCWALQKTPAANVHIETIWKLVSWPINVVMSEEAKVLPPAFNRFNLHGAAALLFVLRKEKGLKNKRRVAVYTWQRLYVVTCGFYLQVTVISPSNAWNGRGFCIVLFVRVIPVSCESWLGTKNWLELQQKTAMHKLSWKDDTERLFLTTPFMLSAGHGTIFGSLEHLRFLEIQWETSLLRTRKMWAREKTAVFCWITLFSARFTASYWGLFSNWQSQLKYHKIPDIHSCFYLPIHP